MAGDSEEVESHRSAPITRMSPKQAPVCWNDDRRPQHPHREATAGPTSNLFVCCVRVRVRVHARGRRVHLYTFISIFNL